MKKQAILLLMSILSSFFGYGQTFPTDRARFSKQLLSSTAQFALDSDQEFIKKTLTPYLLSEANMSNEMFEKMVATSNLMLEKKIRVYPEVYQYIYATYVISLNNVSSTNYENWHVLLSSYLQGRSMNNAKEFVDFSYYFFKENTIASRSNFTWKYIGGDFEISKEKEPTINFKNGKLVCYLDNRKKGEGFLLIDSVVVHNSKGVFKPMKNDYQGEGGKITWEKAGLNPKEVYADFLSPYVINTRTSKLSVDTVLMTTPVFDTKVKGQLSDVAQNIHREIDKVNPQFISYEKSLKIKNFSKGVDYEGGFKYEGASFVGSSVGNSPAQLIIYREGSEIIAKVYADLIVNNEKQITANNAKMAIFLSRKDSIYHPSLSFVLNKSNSTFEFTRDVSGAGSAPFSSEYFKLNMYVPKLTWKQGDDHVALTYGMEVPGELRQATFESKAFFSKESFTQMQGMESIHPLVKLYNYCYKYDEFNITEAKFATAMERTVDQSRELLFLLERDGYIIRDRNTKKVVVTDKVIHAIESSKSKVDYDNIVFKSDLRMAKMPAQYTAEDISRNPRLQQLDSIIKAKNAKRRTVRDFGKIDLNALAIQLNAVERVDLSEAKFTFVLPDEEQITIKRDRNFDFKGWLRSGKVEVQVKKGTYDYAKHSVSLDETGNMLMAVNPLKPEDGDKLIFLNSSITNSKGTLYVDDPNNRSGNMKEGHEYPRLKVTNSPKVYYSNGAIQRGAYDSTRFYFAVEPFEIDSLVKFEDKGLTFKGQLVSAGIFPTFKEQLRVMNDYSLGFVQQAPAGGYPFYETTAKYDNKIVLSNNGLQGSGKIAFVKSVTESAQFTFLPDSTIGIAKFSNAPSETGVQFPDVNGVKTSITYNPRKKYLNVQSLEDPILLFDSIQYVGQLTVKAEGITGNGIVMTSDANLRSRVFEFSRWHAKARVADFNLKNKYAEKGENALSFITKNIDADLDFKARKGVFKSNEGETKTEFPLNNFYCLIDKYTWFMDEEEVVVESTDRLEQARKNIDISAGLGLATPNFFSTNVKQDSLSFMIPKATFSLQAKTIFCNKVKFVDIADARIFPNEEKLNILRKGKIEKLTKAQIVANYITKYHTFDNAEIDIHARRNYVANGEYPFKDADNNVTNIEMYRIYVDSSFQTVGIGKIEQTQDFKLSERFNYYGEVKVIATDPTINFNGATQINHDCKAFTRSWMAFEAPIDPKNIQIPVSENMKTLDGEAVTAGLVWRDARNPDSVIIYPAFLSKVIGETDDKIITASGILQYNPASKEFQIASLQKLQDRGEAGNYISLHTETCSLNGDGEVNLGMNYGDVVVRSFGVVNYDNTTGGTTMNLTSNFVFPKLDKPSFERIAQRISAIEGLQPLDLNSSTLEQAYLELKDKRAADAMKNEFIQRGNVRSVLKELEDGITITGIQLKTHYDGLNNGLITSVSNASLVNIYNRSVFKQIPFKAYFKQVFSGNVTGDKLQFEMNIPGGDHYFFDYGMERRNGKLEIYTSDEAFQSAIEAIKDDKKKARNFSYNTTNNSGILNSFMRIFK